MGMVVGAGVGARVGECCGAVGKGEALEQRVEGGGNDGRGVGKSGEEGVEKRRDSRVSVGVCCMEVGATEGYVREVLEDSRELGGDVRFGSVGNGVWGCVGRSRLTVGTAILAFRPATRRRDF